MKLLLDFLPIVAFFASFKWAEGNPEPVAQWLTQHLGFLVDGGVVGIKEAPVLLSTLIVVVISVLQIVIMKVLRKPIDKMLWISALVVVSLGALTVYFHSETFIKWKPTLLYWAMSLAFLVGPMITGKPLLKVLMGDQVDLPAAVWKRLTLAWVAFFAFMGVLNLWVALNFDTSTWVSFKLFGGMGLMFVFMLGQGWYMMRHLKSDAE